MMSDKILNRMCGLKAKVFMSIKFCSATSVTTSLLKHTIQVSIGAHEFACA